MKYCLIILMACLFLSSTVFAQQQNCCDNIQCRQKAEGLAVKISGLVSFVGKCSNDAAANKRTLDSLKSKNEQVYNDFIKTARAVNEFIDQERQGTCFMRSLPEDESDNIFDWLAFLKNEKPRFPSTEFCTGWKRRFELGQGAMNAFRDDMAYLGSVRGYIIYTFGKPKQCGNKLRLMTGPAFFLQNKVFYATLSSRLSFKLKDIAPVPFSLGNFNLFGEYTTSFNHFEYAALGAEVELGPFGFNLAINQNLRSHHQGFLLSILFGNKKL
ncbi:MAG TPA: hypothetical protein VGQ09_18360 [Chitinophagaceae bacterium]|nr:hypothetical protein [Chitinophagaceae bacterium]